MATKTKQDIGKMFTVTVLLACFVGVGDNELSAAYNAIQSSYPSVSEATFSTFMSGSMLTLLLGTILCPIMARKVSAKKLLFWSYLLFAVTTTFGGASASFTYMLVMRFISGFAMGVASTEVFAIIGDYYVEEKERSKVMGWTSTVGGIFGMLLGLIGGVLASLPDWHPVFYPYAFSFIVAICIMAFIPDKNPARESEEGMEGEGGATKEPYPWGKLIPIYAAFLLYGILYFTSLYFSSFYLVEIGLDESQAAIYAGIFTSASSVAGILAGLIFSPVYMKLKRWTPAISFAISAIVFAVYAFTKNPVVVIIMAFIIGVAYVTVNSYYFMSASMKSSPSQMTLTMAILTACMNVGGFFCTYMMNAIMNVTMTVSGAYLVVAIMFAVGTVLSIVLALRARKVSPEEFADMPMEGMEGMEEAPAEGEQTKN